MRAKRSGLELNTQDLAVLRMSREGKVDREIAQEMGWTREWACKVRNRAERTIMRLNRFAMAQNHHAAALDNLIAASKDELTPTAVGLAAAVAA